MYHLPGLLKDDKWLITFFLCELHAERYPFLKVYIVMTHVGKHPSHYHGNYDLSCVLHCILSALARRVFRNCLGCELVSIGVPSPGSWGSWPSCHLKCLMDWVVGFPVVFFNDEIPPTAKLTILLRRFIFSMIYPQLFLKAGPTLRDHFYLFIYLFYCFSGKNAVRVISLFLDSASQKVCDFTVLTPRVPMHLSFPCSPHCRFGRVSWYKRLGCILCVSEVTVSKKLLGNQKDQHLPESFIS